MNLKLTEDRAARGRHIRWHRNRRKVDPYCVLCAAEQPDRRKKPKEDR